MKWDENLKINIINSKENNAAVSQENEGNICILLLLSFGGGQITS